MIVPTQQIESFSQAAVLDFENDMVGHLAGFSPPLFKVIGEDQLREVIRLGTSRAAGYGFDKRGPVRLYLEMALLFGSYFDTDPQYRWAAAILKSRGLGNQIHRAEALYVKALHYRGNVAGPGDEYLMMALRKLRDRFLLPLPISAESLVPDLLNEITSIYPQKAQYAGTAALEMLIGASRAAASKYEFSAVRGTVLLTGIMVVLGHGCLDDLLYPWIKRTLNDETNPDTASRLESLEKKALTWLNYLVECFENSK